MKFFKDKNDVVYAFASDGSQDQFIPPDLIKISEHEAQQLANPPPSLEQRIAFTVAKRNELFNIASFEITRIEDAVKLELASDEDKNKLLEWVKYRFWLGHLDVSEPDAIIWKQKPK